MDHKCRKKEVSASVFIDQSAAFDLVPKDIFLGKLKIYGFDEVSTNWFNSYLSDRSQSVSIGAKTSSLLSVDVGAPQGGPLSPTIYDIDSNDFPEAVTKESELHLYADDATSSSSNKNLADLIKQTEEEAQEIVKWMDANRLVCNPDKTKFLLMANSKLRASKIGTNKAKIKIGDQEIEESTSEKLLGIILSNSLDWNEHIKDLKKQLGQRLALLRRISKVLPHTTLKSIKDGIFTSKLTYGIAIWGKIRMLESDTSSTNMQSLQVMQDRALRICLNLTWDSKESRSNMLQSSNALSVNQQAAYHTLLLVWNILRTKTPADLYNQFQGVESRMARTSSRSITRGDLSQSGTLNCKRYGFVQQGIRIWNKAPKELKDNKKKLQFKKKAKEWIKLNIPI